MKNNDKIWFNKDAAKIFLVVLIFFSVIVVIANINTALLNQQVSSAFNNQPLIKIFYGTFSLGYIMAYVFLGFMWWLYIIYVFAKKRKKIKINNYPYLKNIYKIYLIPYDSKFEIPNLQVDKDFYYRDLPCNNDLLLAYWISFQFKITNRPQDFIGAILLKIIKDNKIVNIERDQDGYFLDITKITKCEYEYEYMLLDILKSAAVNGILKERNFKEWCQINYKLISSWYQYSLKYEEEKLINEGFIRKESIPQKGWLRILQSSTNIIISNEDLQKIARNLIGLKQYLLNFSLINDKKIVEVHLWEYYLIYAKLFGIADKVKREFKDIYPDFVDLFDDLSVKLALDKDGYVNIQ